MSGNPLINPVETPLLLCLSERDRKGRVIDDDNRFFHDLLAELQLEFHEKSLVIAGGHVGVALALRHARPLIQELKLKHVLIATADSILVAPTLAHYEEHESLLTSQNSNGFIADNLPDNMSRIHEDSVTRRENKTIADAYGGDGHLRQQRWLLEL